MNVKYIEILVKKERKYRSIGRMKEKYMIIGKGRYRNIENLCSQHYINHKQKYIHSSYTFNALSIVLM